jgi:uncharacterized protein YbjQ (UPF0145 family)
MRLKKLITLKNKLCMSTVIVATTEAIAGRTISETLGVVKGTTVRSRNIGRDISAVFKSVIGGEVKTYTDMTIAAREEAYNRMVNEAIELGADAVVGVRFTTSLVMAGASEMLAFGTAVKLQ